MEINASFYRFPSIGWTRAWSKAPESLDFSIKVHRSITHYTRLRGKALTLWKRFRRSLQDIESRISFWLFQMPSRYVFNEKNLEALSEFFRELNLGNQAIVEFRDSSWWKHLDICKDIEIGFCSVDTPELPRSIIAINDVVYLRLHGREVWYNYIYTDEELRSIVDTIRSKRVSKKYIYLNNDEGMLENGKYLIQLIKR